MFNENPSDNQSNKEKSDVDKSVEKGLFEETQNKLFDNNEDDNSTDSIAEYERIISEKLEQKRKDELKKASENMKVKLAKNGRCPICTLAPPCNHYNQETEVKEANRLILSHRSQTKRSNDSVSPQKPDKKDQPLRKSTKKSNKPINSNDKLNRTAYNTDKNKLSRSTEKRMKKPNPRLKPLKNTKNEDEDDALPIIKDEDFETSPTQNPSKPPFNPLKNLPGRRMTHQKPSPAPRLHSHQARTKIRIQGRHGVKSVHYTNLRSSIQAQNQQEARKRYIIKARERHKIQEKIEKYREEKIQREIELLEEAKRLEQEERRREHLRDERR